MIDLLLSSLIAASPPKMLPEKLDLNSNVSQSKLLAGNDISGALLSAATVPAAPSNLVVTSVAKGATSGSWYVYLKWQDNSSDEDGFVILQSRDATTGFTGIKTPAANTTTYGINMGTNPTPGTYYFKVKSKNAYGESTGSNVVSAQVNTSTTTTPPSTGGTTTPTTGTPTAPSNLSLVSSTKSSTGNYIVNLKWQDNSSNETGFNILDAVNSTTDFRGVKSAGANATTFAVDLGTAPTSGTHSFKVKSFNSSGESTGSNVVSTQISTSTSGGTTTPSTGSGFTPPAGYSKVYSTTFDSVSSIGYSFDGWGVQANTGDVTAVTAPGGIGGKSIKITANKSENFSSVANGSPRAEILRSNNNFQQGREYYIHWRVFLPADYQFDRAGAQETLVQIHQDVSSGPPPFILGLDGSNYYMYSEAGNKQYKEVKFGSASGDKGKWVDWTLYYKPSSGSGGVSKLYKNNVLVQTFNGPNAYPNGSTGYFKMGIYKWAWKTAASDVTSRTRYYDNFDIYQK